MEQDIRELFNDDDFTKKELPLPHRKEFLDKLNASKTVKENRFNFNYLLKIAAVLLLFVSVGYFSIKFIGNDTQTIEETALESQIKTVEAQYLKSIETEWNNFLLIANDDKLIKRYKQKLESLDADYKDISQKFKENNNDILIVEKLVENLKIRLQILKDIQEHITLLNQENNTYEKANI